MKVGWQEFQLLFIINQKEQYGYEILNILRNSGKVRFSASSLYPVLRRLEKKELVQTRTQKKDDSADRIYYSITKNGKLILEEFMKSNLIMIDRFMWNDLKELRQLLISKANLKKGDIVIDFSESIGELFALDLYKEVGDSGLIYFLVSESNQIKIYDEYFKINGICNIKTIYDQIPFEKIRNSSIDLAIQLIGLHHFTNPLNIITEMKRVVKPGGKILISDMKKIDHVIFKNISKFFLPDYYRFGTDLNEIKNLLTKCKLEDIKLGEWHGMVIGEAQKPELYPI